MEAIVQRAVRQTHELHLTDNIILATNVSQQDIIIPIKHYHVIKALIQLTFVEVQSVNPLVEKNIGRSDYNWKE